MPPSDFLLLAEPLAIALVDTEGVHRGRAFDLLAGEAQLIRWLELQSARIGPRATTPARYHVLALRSSLRRVFTAVADGTAPPEDDVLVVNDAVTSGGYDVLAWDTTLGAVAVRHGETALGRIAVSAVRVLTCADPGPLRRCANPRCVLFFAATNPRRRFCTPACSLRVRVARHAARR